MDSDNNEDNPLQRWIDAEEWWGNPDGGFGNAPPEESGSATASETEATEQESETIEIDSRTNRYFWSAVVLANIAVGASSLGVMLMGFRGQWAVGGALVFVGVLAGVRTYWTYRTFQSGSDGEEGETKASDRSGNDVS